MFSSDLAYSNAKLIELYLLMVYFFRFATILVQVAQPDVTVGNLQGLRTFRVLRALKTVSIVPGRFISTNA